jgi:predicted metal-dependent enzyme (double-stranded beta helix superfamily)
MVDGDEFFLHTPTVQAFIARARRVLAGHTDLRAALDALRPHFETLLADPTWLPDRYAQPGPSRGAGGGIEQWLLFRAADRSLTLFSLVVPPWESTPVHDHLTWGLVGLYRGRQEELVYRRVDDGADPTHATLELTARRTLRPGDVYQLMPPAEDIHAVSTISARPSISIHLLGRDMGSILRHVFEPHRRRVRPFQSSYSNTPPLPQGVWGRGPREDRLPLSLGKGGRG